MTLPTYLAYGIAPICTLLYFFFDIHSFVGVEAIFSLRMQLTHSGSGETVFYNIRSNNNNNNNNKNHKTCNEAVEIKRIMFTSPFCSNEQTQEDGGIRTEFCAKQFSPAPD